jgi:hypothetical protein
MLFLCTKFVKLGCKFFTPTCTPYVEKDGCKFVFRKINDMSPGKQTHALKDLGGFIFRVKKPKKL